MTETIYATPAVRVLTGQGWLPAGIARSGGGPGYEVYTESVQAAAPTAESPLLTGRKTASSVLQWPRFRFGSPPGSESGACTQESPRNLLPGLAMLDINLPQACERREAIDREFSKVGLAYELWPAVDGHCLADDDHRLIDHVGRARTGLHLLDNPSVACLLSHLAAFRDLVVSEDDMLAVFEDDARLHSGLPDVLDALKAKAEKFDIVKLERRSATPYFPVHQLLRSHSLGRLKYYEHGICGYVVTRHAAEHLLQRYPTTYWEIDLLIGQFWDNGLENVLYVDPSVVLHDDQTPSEIERER